MHTDQPFTARGVPGSRFLRFALLFALVVSCCLWFTPTATVPGLTFKQALFGIWLSDDPVQQSLKTGLLGN